MIDKTAMRVGRERYLAERGTRGAGTLYTRDVLVDGPLIAVSFPAKSGKVAEYAFADPKLADAIARIKTLPGKRLLSYRDAEGKVRPIKTEAINSYLRTIAGADISAKDFRTLHASALAGEALAAARAGGVRSRPQAADRGRREAGRGFPPEHAADQQEELHRAGAVQAVRCRPARRDLVEGDRRSAASGSARCACAKRSLRPRRRRLAASAAR